MNKAPDTGDDIGDSPEETRNYLAAQRAKQSARPGRYFLTKDIENVHFDGRWKAGERSIPKFSQHGLVRVFIDDEHEHVNVFYNSVPLTNSVNTIAILESLQTDVSSGAYVAEAMAEAPGASVTAMMHMRILVELFADGTITFADIRRASRNLARP